MGQNQLDSTDMTVCEQLLKASCSSGGDLSRVMLSVVFNPAEDFLRKTSITADIKGWEWMVSHE